MSPPACKNTSPEADIERSVRAPPVVTIEIAPPATNSTVPAILLMSALSPRVKALPARNPIDPAGVLNKPAAVGVITKSPGVSLLLDKV